MEERVIGQGKRLGRERMRKGKERKGEEREVKGRKGKEDNRPQKYCHTQLRYDINYDKQGLIRR